METEITLDRLEPIRRHLRAHPPEFMLVAGALGYQAPVPVPARRTSQAPSKIAPARRLAGPKRTPKNFLTPEEEELAARLPMPGTLGGAKI